MGTVATVAWRVVGLKQGPSFPCKRGECFDPEILRAHPRIEAGCADERLRIRCDELQALAQHFAPVPELQR